MINKTSDISFKKYGSVYYDPINLKKYKLLCKQMHTTDKTVSCLFSFTCDVYIELISGLATILIGDSFERDTLETFAVHHNLIINKNTYFNIIPLSDKTICYLITPQDYSLRTEFIEPYIYQPIIPKIKVSEILGYYYVIKSPKYRFHGEAHAYYELTYVDHGSLDTTVDTTTYTLHNYDLMIYGPDQFHTQQITADTSCSYLTVIFNMSIDDDSLLLNKVISCNNELHNVFKKFIRASSDSTPYAKTLMLCYLQEIIILLLQLSSSLEKNKPISLGNHAMQHFQEDVLQQILEYMNQTVSDAITIEEICHKFSISRSTLQALFKTHLQDSPKNYLINIKLQKSKELIRENKYTISEIAFTLGFSSIHYFSRIFKKHFGLAPSDYAKKIYRN